MQTFTVRNVNHALPFALATLRNEGIPVAPRGMKTLELDGPVATTYTEPREMVLFDADRDANPFFHFFEALWILAGRKDVASLAYFLPRMADFSDDGVVFNAPYGYRLRQHFGFDQIEAAIEKLKADPETRQAVLSIWDAEIDGLSGRKSKDFPCNDMIMLKVRDGKLRMTVCNRSNDVLWGAYGANVVQFSTLLVYLAGRVGVGVGAYTQISDSFHVYDDNPFWNKWLDKHRYGVPPALDPYDDELLVAQMDPKSPRYMHPDELVSGDFDHDLKLFWQWWDDRSVVVDGKFNTFSFQHTVWPMMLAFEAWKSGDRAAGRDKVNYVRAPDWRLAGQRWMDRRLDKKDALTT